MDYVLPVQLINIKTLIKMLTPRITCCKECAEIQPLIDQINCKLLELSKSAYNNIVYGLGIPINHTAVFDLLNYKRILEYKKVNEHYACQFTVNMIANKIKKYVTGCKQGCKCSEGDLTPTTTTTSSSTSTSTSTTSSTTSTTTTLAPTTTTTTTTFPSFNFAGPAGTSGGACGNSGFPIKLYSSVSVLNNGVILYSDSGLTTPYTGGGFYYREQISNKSYGISGGGVIFDTFTCL